MVIQSTQCECPRGDHKCSHAAALYIYGIHNLSRTDVECQWKRKKSDLPTTSAPAEMFPNIPYRPLSRLPNEEDRSFLYKELSAIGKFTGLFWIMSPEVPQQTPKTSAPLIDNVIKVVIEAKKDERPFLFKKLMAVDKLKIAAVNQETIGQRDNELWHCVRKGR